MPARVLVNTVSFVLGSGFTLGLFLAIAHFLRAHEDAAESPDLPEDLETVMITMPPPPPPPKAEEPPLVVPDMSEAIALGLAEEPSASPVQIAPSPPSVDELLPMIAPPAQVVAGGFNLESTFKPNLDVTFDENHIFQRSEVDKLPFPISRPEPSVPASVLGERRKRTAVLLFVVDVRGQVGNVRVLRSSNNSEFDEIMMENIHEWKFSPAIRKGRPVRCMIQQQITVELGHRDIFSL